MITGEHLSGISYDTSENAFRYLIGDITVASPRPKSEHCTLQAYSVSINVINHECILHTHKITSNAYAKVVLVSRNYARATRKRRNCVIS